MKLLNRCAVILIPRLPFLEWLRFVDPSSESLELADLANEPSVYLVAGTDDDDAFDRLLSKVYLEIFEEELEGWWTDRDAWPAERGFETFKRWFEIRSHSMVIDTVPRPIRREPLD